jgi:uncharacterized protein YjdB
MNYQLITSTRNALFAVVLTCLLAAFGCSGGSGKGNDPPPAPKLVSIAITPASQTIAPLTTQQFIATGTYSDNSTQNITGSVSWSSSKTAVATIGDSSPTNGLATGVAKGTTTITATSGTISSTASLNVTSATATSLAISGPSSMAIDVSQQFTATATFSDGTMQDVTNVANWASTSPSVASVTVSGLVSARNIGSTTISAAFEAVSKSASLTVDASNLTSISIKNANGVNTIAQGTNTLLTATGTFNNGSTDNLSSRVTWHSSDTSIASFSPPSSQISGLKPGTVTITATLGSISGSIQFTVSAATINSNGITVTPVNQTIPIGWHQRFTATGAFTDGTTQDISSSVQWTSDNSNVATIGSSNGVGLGVNQGNANITAAFSFAGASATGATPLTVSSATLSSITLSSGSGKTLLAPGSSLQINAKGTWTNQTSQNINPYAIWSSSNTKVAIIGAGGVVTGQSTGTTTITATYSGQSATLDLVVEGSTLISIKITPQSFKLPATIETQLTATGTFSDGKQLNLTSGVIWTSSNPSVATVSNASNNAGVATGVAIGSSTISAAFAGQNATTTITVTNATLTAINVTPASSSISLGASQMFTAQGTFTDNSVVNISVQTDWTSSNVAVATINSSGIASSASSGTTTIRASLNGVSGTAILTVQ